jgi:hypothetical protein
MHDDGCGGVPRMLLQSKGAERACVCVLAGLLQLQVDSSEESVEQAVLSQVSGMHRNSGKERLRTPSCNRACTQFGLEVELKLGSRNGVGL